MKIIWEEKDILVGTLYFRPGTQEVWMIGYVSNPAEDDRRFVSASMNDGMVTSAYTRNEMVGILTTGGYIPAMIAPGLGIELPQYIKAFILSKMPT